MTIYHQLQFAATAASEESPGLFQALGIDWKMLVLQSLGFLILVWLLGKFVYPILIRAIDARQDEVEASAKAAHNAQVAAEKAGHAISKQLQEARDSAAEIVAIAQKEAGVLVAGAEAKAVRRTDRMVAQAEARLEADVTKAREQLRKEMVSLVADATEAVLSEKIDSAKDAALIQRALSEKK